MNVLVNMKYRDRLTNLAIKWLQEAHPDLDTKTLTVHHALKLFEKEVMQNNTEQK